MTGAQTTTTERKAPRRSGEGNNAMREAKNPGKIGGERISRGLSNKPNQMVEAPCPRTQVR